MQKTLAPTIGFFYIIQTLNSYGGYCYLIIFQSHKNNSAIIFIDQL